MIESLQEQKHAEITQITSLPKFNFNTPKTHLNVMVNRTNDQFISGWLLSPDQRKHMELNGNIT